MFITKPWIAMQWKLRLTQSMTSETVSKNWGAVHEVVLMPAKDTESAITRRCLPLWDPNWQVWWSWSQRKRIQSRNAVSLSAAAKLLSPMQPSVVLIVRTKVTFAARKSKSSSKRTVIITYSSQRLIISLNTLIPAPMNTRTTVLTIKSKF